MRRILEYKNHEAKNFFLKEESYFNLDLPKYFIFDKLLKKVSEKIDKKQIHDICENKKGSSRKKDKLNPNDFEGVNYTFLNNKDGKFSWRPFQLIHPALYVSLINRMTETSNWQLIIERFKELQNNPKIVCQSIPFESEKDSSDTAESIINWYQSIEQKSIELALKYSHVLHTDITDCYGSIYTHSVAWALHTRPVAKKERFNNNLIGNIIDIHLRHMSYGQTNSIPQGSVLMDFIAEMVLGYADSELSNKLDPLSISEYQILRYRDDYRIFTNNPEIAELIVKHLTEVLNDLGLRLNAQKTKVSNNVITSSIKPDKLYWIANKKGARSLQEHLLLIHSFAEKYPNSGSLNKALNKFFSRIYKLKETNQNILVLISIVVDIAYKNPRIYPIASAIISKLILLVEESESRQEIADLIMTKFNKIPNTGYLQIWLQRVFLKGNTKLEFQEPLCKKVIDKQVIIWNSDWLKSYLKNVIIETPIIDKKKIDEMDEIIDLEEVQLFDSKPYYQ